MQVAGRGALRVTGLAALAAALLALPAPAGADEADVAKDRKKFTKAWNPVSRSIDAMVPAAEGAAQACQAAADLGDPLAQSFAFGYSDQLAATVQNTTADAIAAMDDTGRYPIGPRAKAVASPDNLKGLTNRRAIEVSSGGANLVRAGKLLVRAALKTVDSASASLSHDCPNGAVLAGDAARLLGDSALQLEMGLLLVKPGP